MDETPAGFSIITTITGVLLATMLIAVLGATLFMWVDTRNARDAQAVATAVEGDLAEGDRADADTGAIESAASETTEAGATGADSGDEGMNEASEEAMAGGTGADETDGESTEMTDDAAAAPEASPDVAAAFMKGTCVGCHVIPGVPNAVGITGPDLAGIATIATTRVAGQSAEEYIRASILQPDEYIVPDCPTGPCAEGVMLPTFGDMLSEGELNDVVDYLLTLE